jgi:hypothetical protein
MVCLTWFFHPVAWYVARGVNGSAPYAGQASNHCRNHAAAIAAVRCVEWGGVDGARYPDRTWRQSTHHQHITARSARLFTRLNTGE